MEFISGMGIPVIVLIVVILIILARCIRIVQQSKAYVIERLGN